MSYTDIINIIYYLIRSHYFIFIHTSTRWRLPFISIHLCPVNIITITVLNVFDYIGGHLYLCWMRLQGIWRMFTPLHVIFVFNTLLWAQLFSLCVYHPRNIIYIHRLWMFTVENYVYCQSTMETISVGFCKQYSPAGFPVTQQQTHNAEKGLTSSLLLFQQRTWTRYNDCFCLSKQH